jgi:hypothetical protein
MWDFDTRKTGEAKLTVGDKEVVFELKEPTGLEFENIRQKAENVEDDPTAFAKGIIGITVLHEGKKLKPEQIDDLFERLNLTAFASLFSQVMSFVRLGNQGN